MRGYLFLSAMLLSLTGMGQVPDVVITTLMSANGYGTVAGRLTAKPDGPVGVSVRNGNVMYSTISDPEGRWGIVIRHLSTQVTANSFSLVAPSDRGADVVAFVDSPLPWNRSVSARESSVSEISAKHQTETALRWEIDKQRANCRADQGKFSYSGGFVHCNKIGSIFQCSATAYCSCRNAAKDKQQ